MSVQTSPDRTGSRRLLWVGLLVAVLLAGIVSYHASGSPDGLEKVAGDNAMDNNVTDSVTANSPLADYGVSGVDDARASVGLSGLIGVAVTFAVGAGLFIVLSRRSKQDGGG